MTDYQDSRLKVFISLPYLYSVRDFLFTPVWEEMAARENVHFHLWCENPQASEAIAARGRANISAVEFPSILPGGATTTAGKILDKLLARRFRRKACRWIDERCVFDSVKYRFAALSNLSHYHIRRNKGPVERKRHQVFSDYRSGELVGQPFPRSRLMFRLLYNFPYGWAHFLSRKDWRAFKQLGIDLVVFARLHNYTTAYWARRLRRLGTPMIGIVSSWDHPTTKDPTPRGMSEYIVASERMVEEMSGLHGIDAERIRQIGKVQMDVFRDESAAEDRGSFLGRLGVPADHKLVVFGTNVKALKDHEVSIARRMAADFSAGRYGKSTLLIRSHPQDRTWRQDFDVLTDPPNVICFNACGFGDRAEDDLESGRDDQVFLANLMRHSDVVVQSRGSLALDAAAFDVPVISLAFDGDLDRSGGDCFIEEYAFEHYKPIVSSEGTWMVGSYDALDRAISGYLADPSIHAAGRATIRRDHVEPLDGGASKRLVDCIVESAQRARDGSLPPGDWDYPGLGDVTWASRQVCDVHSFVDY